MNEDPTESIRRALCAIINANPQPRTVLEQEFGQVWDTAELVRDYEAEAFMAPFVVVTRRSDGARGSLYFQHGPPRLYWSWEEDLKEAA